ncbi:MAG: hypothetical protein COT17_07095 [Elusimicrobia bacterium CG08_land_8_20_14_0_20_51_18]|nr:MAG: hypothetical protein COT17_07095 [Elusimicrobia bacterium CG08_land_8_20_14_0_20_51_18]
MSYFFIINPKAGKEKKSLEGLIREKFAVRKTVYELEYTESRGHALELARMAVVKGYKTVVAAGGDGTIRETASALLTKDEMRLGIIPSGSGNGLARNLHIPLNIGKALDGLLEWKPRKIDSVLCNGAPFFCASGVGIDAEIAHLFNSKKHSRGILPYFYNSFGALLKRRPAEISIFSENLRLNGAPLIASILNGEQYGGGAKMAPDAYIDDGYADLVTIENISLLKILFTLGDLFSGKILRNDFAKSYKIKTAEFRLPAGSWYHLDGEDFFSGDGVLKFSVLPASLNVLCPEL